MAEALPRPKLDENAKVGLTLISAVYGVVLVAVFPAQDLSLSRIGVVGWFHLGLTTFMLIVSWMGYYNNRQVYPVWRVQFFNIPLFQYLISFAILFGYWELGFTIQSPAPGSVPTPTLEALIITLIFFAYLVWDFLEVAVQEKPKYTKALTDAKHESWCPPRPTSYQRRWPSGPVRRHADANGWFAKNVRGGRAVTFVFFVLYAVGLLLSHLLPLRGTITVCVYDGVAIASLFAYRYLQWWWPRAQYEMTEAAKAELAAATTTAAAAAAAAAATAAAAG
jgi:hypothetical protein